MVLTTDLTAEIKSWREAHKLLSHAVLVSNEAVDSIRAQRRYWMEEICSNLTSVGTLASTSVWKKPVAPKKAVKKRRKKDEEESPNKSTSLKKVKAAPRRKKKNQEQPTKKTLQLKLSASVERSIPQELPVAPDNDEEEVDDENDDSENEDYEYLQDSRQPIWEHHPHHPQLGIQHQHHGGYYSPQLMVCYLRRKLTFCTFDHNFLLTFFSQMYKPYNFMSQHTAHHPSTSMHDDLMNIPEELREFMGVAVSNPPFTEQVDQESDEDDDDDDNDEEENIGEDENVDDDESE